ncbi:MAG: hypothetical protein A2202_06605 [Bdellovibrionales bacterium RIFOXYA1_FULL_36_14]|nr:MAG: hypothetical protein A2202_06605 [Bdellovibrionales bacterium RIFOXYA1_FULL_36_14]
MTPNNASNELNQTSPLKLKIAVVDDSSFSRKTMIEILEEDGHIVVGEASNAEMAIQIAHTTNVDLFIIDVVMPEVSGIELMNALKEYKKKSFAYILISSLNVESVIIDAISGGAQDFISKPFDKNDLLSSVNKIAQNIESDK